MNCKRAAHEHLRTRIVSPFKLMSVKSMFSRLQDPSWNNDIWKEIINDLPVTLAMKPILD